jgi:hypothetical protein
MVSAEWLDLQSRFPSLILNKFIIMPNHFHGIICISPDSAVNPTLKPQIDTAESDFDDRILLSRSHERTLFESFEAIDDTGDEFGRDRRFGDKIVCTSSKYPIDRDCRCMCGEKHNR